MDSTPASHADSFSQAGLFKAEVNKLKDTQLVVSPDVPLMPNLNVLWCGTLTMRFVPPSGNASLLIPAKG